MLPVLLDVLPWLGLRNPFSMLSHLLGAVLSLAILLLLLQRARCLGRDDPWAQASLVVYGLSMALAFGASALFHGPIRPPENLILLKKLDHAAIFLMIAGTATAVYGALAVSRRLKRGLITAVWLVSLGGLIVKMVVWPMPLWLTSFIYLTVGWAAAVGLFVVVRTLGWRRLRLFLAGSIVLTAGAVIFAMEAPILWSGIVEGHELFHVMVLVGTGLHVAFIYHHCTMPGAFEDCASEPESEPAMDLEWAPVTASS